MTSLRAARRGSRPTAPQGASRALIVDDSSRGGDPFAPATLAPQATRREPSMECDLVVLGSGPGGYPAAIRAAQLGASVVIVEQAETVGGTCLNVGCIPTKAMVQSAHAYNDAQGHFAQLGVRLGNIDLDFEQVQSNRRGIVDGVVKGLGRPAQGQRHPGRQGPRPLQRAQHDGRRGRRGRAVQVGRDRDRLAARPLRRSPASTTRAASTPPARSSWTPCRGAWSCSAAA